MKFQVPQFIEVEDRIFGPLTFKQFVYLAGGGGLCFLLFRFTPTFIAMLLSAPIAGLSIALAFYKINNKPFIDLLQSGFKYFTGSKLFIWRKKEKKIEQAEVGAQNVDASYIPNVSDSKLEDISWSLGVKRSLYADESPNQNMNREQYERMLKQKAEEQ